VTGLEPAAYPPRRARRNARRPLEGAPRSRPPRCPRRDRPRAHPRPGTRRMRV